MKRYKIVHIPEYGYVIKVKTLFGWKFAEQHHTGNYTRKITTYETYAEALQSVQESKVIEF